MIRRAILAAVAVAAVAIRAGAQASPTVPPSAQVYRDLERMASLGILDTMIVGIRPITETEIVRLLTSAARNVDRNPAAREWTEPTIRAYLAQFAPRKRRFIDSATVESVRLSSPARLAPSDLNGSVDAEINPLGAYRGGRPIVDGTTFALETAHSATIGKWVALTANPRATLLLPVTGGQTQKVVLQTASATAMFGDFAVQVGRDYASFGQAWTGGLLMSDNAPPVDMVRVWNDQSWRVPVLSKVFGPIRGAAFVANLGTARQRYPHTRLIGYHVSGQPHPQFEIGVAVVDAMGGRGGQPATFWERFLDVIPVVDAFRTKSDFQFSNKLAGLDVRWRMPRWAGLEAYAEVDADDFDGRDLSRGFLEDAGYLFGASISCFIRCGRVGLRAEYHQTGIRYYTHIDYPMAAQGWLLGDPLGPRGVGGYVTVDADGGRAGRFAVQSAFEVRSGNTYRSVATGANDVGFHFELLERRPGEKRSRIVGSWSGFDNRPLGVQLAVGAEHVTNFAFEQGASRTNWLGRIAIVGRPR